VEEEKLACLFLLLRVDASTTVRYINKGKGSSIVLTSIMRRIYDLCIKWGISVVAEHIAGVRMIAVGMDSMSRIAEFSVAPRAFRKLN
jgi:hypothetical protein